MGNEMFILDLVIDGRTVKAWSTDGGTGQVASVGRRVSLSYEMGRDGVELHVNDLPAVRRLMHEWSLSGEPPSAGVYRPQDGMSFLLAVYGTYGRGSRVRAIPRQHGGPCPTQEQRQ